MAADPGMLKDWYKDFTKDQGARQVDSANAGIAPAPGMLATAQPPPAAQAATTQWKPDANSTVAGQFSKITADGSPLIDQATTAAKQASASRGLLNSTMGVTAGLDAAYRAALPIAQQDANTNAGAAQFNAGAANTTSQFNASAVNELAKTREGFAQQTSLQREDISARLDQQSKQIQADASSQGRALTAQEQAQLRDIQNQKDRQTAGFAQQTDLQTADFAQQSKSQSADLASRYNLANMDVASREKLQAADAANQQKIQAANAELQRGLQSTDVAVRQSMQVYDAELKKSMQGMDTQSRLQIATLDADNKVTLAGIEAKYREKLQANQSMAASYQGMVDGMTRIMVSPDMDASAKQAAINSMTTLYNNTLQMQSDITGLAIGKLLTSDEIGGSASPTSPTSPSPVLRPSPQTPDQSQRDW